MMYMATIYGKKHVDDPVENIGRVWDEVFKEAERKADEQRRWLENYLYEVDRVEIEACN